jgi:hypothetical protein
LLRNALESFANKGDDAAESEFHLLSAASVLRGSSAGLV